MRIKRVHGLDMCRLQQRIYIDILFNQLITLWMSFLELNMQIWFSFFMKRERNKLPPIQRNFLFGGSRKKVVIVDTMSHGYKSSWRLTLKYLGRRRLLVGYKYLIAFVFFVAVWHLRKWNYRRCVHIFAQMVQLLNFEHIFGFLCYWARLKRSSLSFFLSSVL